MTARDRTEPARRAAWPVVAPLLLATALLALLGVASADLLSAARAYVAGESLWSKARHQASRHLRDYIERGDAAALAAFERLLAVPLGDRQARLALDASPLDAARVREGFERGGNHPDDVAGMTRLYRWFGDIGPIARAVEAWAAADGDIVRLQALAAEAAQPALAEAQRAALLPRLAALDERLAAYEIEFSRRLGEASRYSARWLLGSTLVLGLLLSVFASLFASRALRRIAGSEASQRQSNARWQMAAEAARIGLFEWNLAANTLDSDARCLALHGLLPEDAGANPEQRGTPTSDLFRQVNPDDRAGVIAANRAGLAGQGLWRARFRAQRRGGGWRQLELIAARSPQPEIVIGLVRDVSDEELAAQLRRDKEAAEQASAAKTAFLSRASHELRTPLNAVLGFAQMMQLDAAEPLGPGQRRRLGFVLQGGEHLLRLVNDILDLSSAEQGEHGVAIGRADLAAAVRTAVGLLDPLARSRGITVEVAPMQHGLAARADPQRLEQVLMNLLSNAVKYTRPGGHVWIESAPAEPGWAGVTVRDDGIGMTEEQLAGLFQPFNRLGAERSAVEGAGLGLVVSKSLVERFGGRLEVTSRPRVGTTMRVLLPRAEVVEVP